MRMTPGWAVSSTITPQTSVFWSPSGSALAPPSTSAPGRANSTMPLSALCWWSALPSGPSSALWTASPSGWSSPAALRSASWPQRKIPLGHRRHHRCPAPGHPAGCRPHLGHRDGPLFAGGFLCDRGGERPVLPRPHPKVFSPGGGRRAGVLVHRRFRGPHRRHCAGTAIHRSPLMQRAAEAEFWLPQPFLFVICPKTQPICKKCYNFFFKNGVLPLTALL